MTLADIIQEQGRLYVLHLMQNLQEGTHYSDFVVAILKKFITFPLGQQISKIGQFLKGVWGICS